MARYGASEDCDLTEISNAPNAVTKLHNSAKDGAKMNDLAHDFRKEHNSANDFTTGKQAANDFHEEKNPANDPRRTQKANFFWFQAAKNCKNFRLWGRAAWRHGYLHIFLV